MLVITRKKGSCFSIYCGDPDQPGTTELKVHTIDIRGNQVRIGIDAPKEFQVLRDDLIKKKVKP